MNLEEARSHAEEWIAAWNAHDIERILAAYADDAVLHSPRAARWDPSIQDGAIRGKPRLRSYFETALKAYPKLTMELLDAYVAGDAMVVEYLNRPNDETELYVLERSRLLDGRAVDIESAYGLERGRSQP